MSITANFDTRMVIWALDGSIELEDVPDLLRLQYNIPIDYLSDREIPSIDKTLMNGWSPKTGDDFEIESLDVGGIEIRYLSSIGVYEIPESSTKAIIDGRLLPRDYRVFNRTVDAVFFELHERVYCVLEVSASQENRVRSILFGQGQGFKSKKDEWGKVVTKKMAQYSLDSRFFYWIFSKRGQVLDLRLQKDDNKIPLNILDISAVSQLSDRNVHDHRNVGPDVLGSVPALSGLGINQNVYEGGFQLLINDIQLFCRFSNDCTCVLDSARSISTSGEQVMENFPKLAITIYTVLIPGLVANFHSDTQVGGSWTPSQELDQRKRWALQVIKHLANDNNILLEDLEDLF